MNLNKERGSTNLTTIGLVIGLVVVIAIPVVKSISENNEESIKELCQEAHITKHPDNHNFVINTLRCKPDIGAEPVDPGEGLGEGEIGGGGKGDLGGGGK